jgi:hypothetical protein
MKPDPKHCLSEIWYRQTTTTRFTRHEKHRQDFGPKNYTDIIVSPLGSSVNLCGKNRLGALLPVDFRLKTLHTIEPKPQAGSPIREAYKSREVAGRTHSHPS